MRIKVEFVMLVIAMIMISSGLFAQIKKIENIKKISLNGVKAISEKNEIKGYYALYFIEKKDNKDKTYLLEIMDSNLKTTQTIQIIKPSSTVLLEGQFNGQNFCFAFLDFKTKSLRIDIYDQEGRKNGSYHALDLDKMAFYVLSNKIENDNDYYTGTISSVPNEGFLVNYTAKNNGAKYTLTMLDNFGRKVWTNTSGDPKTAYETFNVLNVDEDNIVGDFYTRNSKFSMELKQEVVLIDAKTGNRKFKFNNDKQSEFLITYGADFIEEENVYILFGEVFGRKNGKIDIKDKQGFFVRSFDETGNEIKSKICTWKGDISKITDVNKRGKIGNGVSVMIHNVIKTKDNRYFAIGEQFNKEVSAGGVAKQTMGGNVSAMKVVLSNFMIFEFDENFELENVEVIDVDKTDVPLPRGYGVVSEDKLGFVLKYYGLFNYNFSTISSDRSNFSAVYSFNSKGTILKKDRFSVGSITLNGDKKVVNSAIDITSKPTSFISLPAKPGYIGIFEYFSKEKMAEIRIEKLDL